MIKKVCSLSAPYLQADKGRLDCMEFQNYFPIWNKLNAVHQGQILGTLITRTVKKRTVIHNGSNDCTGLLLVKSGQLRAYILSDEGREITIYRLFDRDMCPFPPQW